MPEDTGHLPTFLVIGAQKCGTSWIASAIDQHPNAFISERKEPDYFSKHNNKSLSWYKSFFNTEAKARGEASTTYFWTFPSPEATPHWHHPNTPALVRKTLPDAKLILLLRDPVERAISAYYFHISKGHLRPDQRLQDVWDDWGIFEMECYDVHLRRWLEHFPRDQFLVHVFEEAVITYRAKTMRETYEFIDIDPSFLPKNLAEKKNARRSHLHLRLKSLWPPLASLVPVSLAQWGPVRKRAHIPVGEDERQELIRRYTPHVKRLEDMLGRSLPWKRDK